MLQAYAYILYLLSGFLLLAVFFGVYTKITPYNELALIQEGNVAAAFSLGGAMIGFSLTLASSVLHSNTYLLFIGWAVGAMIVQAISYAAITRVVPKMNAGIAENNIAMGALMGTTSLTVGIINAACLS